MQEITYSDILRHYQMKAAEIQEQLEKMQEEMTVIEQDLESAWSGDNAELVREKLWEIKSRFERTGMNLSDVRQLLEKFQTAAELSGN